jgi:mannosyltransferase OCH1-like enzyme
MTRQTLKSLRKRLNKRAKEWRLRLTEYPLVEIDRERPPLVQPEPSRIPAVVHQTWVDRRFGKTHHREIQKFRARNPDQHFVLYDQDELEAYMARSWGEHPIYQVFAKAKFGPMRADIFRYCILFERGGYYFDIGKGMACQISDLCSGEYDGFVSYESNDCFLPPDHIVSTKVQHPTKYVVQWGMGFSKGHPVLGALIASICENYGYFKGRVFANPKVAILAYTATGLFTKVVRNAIDNDPRVNIRQAGIDFDGLGIVSMRGSRVRYLTSPAYADATNDWIVA